MEFVPYLDRVFLSFQFPLIVIQNKKQTKEEGQQIFHGHFHYWICSSFILIEKYGRHFVEQKANLQLERAVQG